MSSNDISIVALLLLLNIIYCFLFWNGYNNNLLLIKKKIIKKVACSKIIIHCNNNTTVVVIEKKICSSSGYRFVFLFDVAQESGRRKKWFRRAFASISHGISTATNWRTTANLLTTTS